MLCRGLLARYLPFIAIIRLCQRPVRICLLRRTHEAISAAMRRSCRGSSLTAPWDPGVPGQRQPDKLEPKQARLLVHQSYVLVLIAGLLHRARLLSEGLCQQLPTCLRGASSRPQDLLPRVALEVQ